MILRYNSGIPQPTKDPLSGLDLAPVLQSTLQHKGNWPPRAVVMLANACAQLVEDDEEALVCLEHFKSYVDYVLCLVLGGYSFVMLLPYSITTGALEALVFFYHAL